MDDTFMEKIVARRKTGQDYWKITGLMVASFLIMAAIMMFGGYFSFLVPLLLVGLGYGLWFLLSGMNREYEYIVTNGDLDIDMIIARRRRKRVFSGKAKEFELMAKVSSDDYRQAAKGNRKLLDCSSSIKSPNNWFIEAEYKGERLLVIFEPDERMLKNLKRFNPSRIKYVPYGA
ncbi:MAG TPA: hypothetical protein DD640_01120 [Clostridiales bacterium]|nr:hypothetical protein [Clostridiales bacterium]